MEQKKINAIIIAGLIVVGVGAWAGPIMTAQTANEFFGELANVQEMTVLLGDDAGVNFDAAGLGNLKDQIFIGFDPAFLPPPPQVAGPLIELRAFTQLLVPADVVGELLPVGNAPNVFGTPVTLVEYRPCANAEDLDGPGNSGPATLKDCEPAIVEKLFIMSPADQLNKKYRVQLALCSAAQATMTVADGDNDPTNDLCGPNAGAAFQFAIIIMDVLVQLEADHTVPIILEAGAINPGNGNVLMARAADSVGGAEDVNVWVGLKRVGATGAFDFVNPAIFGGQAPSACVKFTIKNNTQGNPAIQGATISLNMPPPAPNAPSFTDVQTTDVNGMATFTPIPEGFANVQLQVPNKPPFPLDRPILNAGNNSAAPPNNANADPNCNETEFTLPVGI